ncbi:MAG: metal-binding protein [Pyrinomonadaceae bacterium]
MPSGKTHDAITIILAVPAFAATYAVTSSVFSSATVAVAFIFGGIMFGPDLDTVSRQYSRWFFLRPLWLPYRWCFKHRSRFSHGLILGALLRVVYFLGVSTLAVYLIAFSVTSVNGSTHYDIDYFTDVWRGIGEFVRLNLGRDFLLLVFIGLWLGAASHTFTDMAGSFIKTGRVAKFL